MYLSLLGVCLLFNVMQLLPLFPNTVQIMVGRLQRNAGDPSTVVREILIAVIITNGSLSPSFLSLIM